MYIRLVCFFQAVKCEDGSPILSDSQFSVRARFSIEYTLIYGTEFIRWKLDIGLKIIGVFLDFSKAFNMVNHPLLFQKLERYRIRGVFFYWFESYFSDCFSM